MVYYNMAAQAVDRMSRSGSGDGETSGYDPKTIDDARSQLYGALGNLHSTRGDLDSAMVYYNMALDIFQRHGWDTSCAVAYYNMGETYLEAGRQEDAEDCYLKSLDYGRKVQDSLWIATPLKGLGALYLEKGKTRKALSLLNEADSYFALHDDQEYVFRLETLGLMDKALELENRQQRWVIESMTAALILLVVSVGLFHRWKKTKSRLNEAEAFLEETIDEISQSSASKDSSEARLETSERKQQPTIRLSERELQILRLIADGKTNPQIAELIFLSPETVKWYRKKLLAKFEASNAADMVRKALEGGFLDQDGGK